jgi:hypothetical protein
VFVAITFVVDDLGVVLGTAKGAHPISRGAAGPSRDIEEVKRSPKFGRDFDQ